MRPETEAVFRRVIAKADQMKRSRFVAQLVEPGYKIEFVKGGTRITRPDEEARDAFVLTLRFFLMQKEPTSLRGLVRVLDEPDVSDQWKKAFSALRAAVNEYLSTAYGEYEYEGGKHRFSNRTILETFLYGGLVHANDPKAVARYEEWMRQPGLDAMLEFWFMSTVQVLLRAIWYPSAICARELERGVVTPPTTPFGGGAGGLTSG